MHLRISETLLPRLSLSISVPLPARRMAFCLALARPITYLNGSFGAAGSLRMGKPEFSL